VLLSGHVKVFLSDEQGREVQLNRLGPGEYFGEVTLDGGPRSASVMALEETRCAVVRRAELLGLIERQPELALHMLRRLARRVRALSENVRSLALMDVYGRVARLLLELAVEEGGKLVVQDKLTHQDIASRVGASRDMIGRIMKDLAVGGYISVDKRRITIHRNPPRHW
jgi:CRP/FNR family cyclic AMP-dependent transcriptional regulator